MGDTKINNKNINNKYRIVVSGARDWTSRSRVESSLKRFNSKSCTLIHGDCKGLDKMAGEVAKELGFEVIAFPAQWDKYGRAAGPIRNIEMLKQKPNVIIIFHDNLDKSRGTLSFVKSAIKMGYSNIMYKCDN